MKRLRAHREDDDDDTDDDDDAFSSRAAFDGVVSALFYKKRLGEEMRVFFVLLSETTDNRDSNLTKSESFHGGKRFFDFS